MVGPLIWLLVFDVVVCLVYWVIFGLLTVTAPPRLMQVMVGLVILINVVIVLVWLLGLLGVAPSGLLHGPSYR
jgi:hypothetical protein